MQTPPTYPAGNPPPHLPSSFTLDDLTPHIETLAGAPAALRDAVSTLTQAQLDTPYRNWTIRQIVHHLPDSHLNVYTRFMLALTEDNPTIKPYSESAWSDLAISRTGDIDTPLALFDAVHTSWIALMRTMSAAAFARAFHHPEFERDVRLADTIPQYAWHARHHTAQILWRRQVEGWD